MTSMLIAKCKCSMKQCTTFFDYISLINNQLIVFGSIRIYTLFKVIYKKEV